jgi:hypothetical protein
MDFYDKLLKHKKSNRLTFEEIGAYINKSKDATRVAVGRKSFSELEIREIEKLFDYKMDKSEQLIVLNEPKKELLSKSKNDVPFYDIDFTSSFLEVENNQTVSPTSYISHPFFIGCDMVVRNSGQSMGKVICHGDAIGLVKIENWREFFPFGEIYAIVTNDGFRMIKVITSGESNDCFTLISKPTDSKKEEFPNQQIKKDSILSIFRVQASSHLF